MATEHPTAGLTHEPMRTCVGCRRPGERSVLLRLVAAEVDGVATVVLDPSRAMPGRGAWLHPDLGCLDLARQRSAFGRSLRLAGPVDPTGVIAQVTALLQAAPPERSQ